MKKIQFLLDELQNQLWFKKLSRPFVWGWKNPYTTTFSFLGCFALMVAFTFFYKVSEGQIDPKVFFAENRKSATTTTQINWDNLKVGPPTKPGPNNIVIDVTGTYHPANFFSTK